MILCTSLLHLAIVSSVPLNSPSGDIEITPIELPLRLLPPKIFDRDWILPEARSAPGQDLLREMRELLEMRFEMRDAQGNSFRSAGDLIAASRGIAAKSRTNWLAGLKNKPPLWTSALDGSLRELLSDSLLHSQDWSPSKDHAQDGLLTGESWNMKKENRAPWSGIDVKPLMEQAAAFLLADLATIKAVENNYRAYPDNVGADYEEIYPVNGTYFTGADEAGNPYSALTLHFRCDLPFPFSDYTTRLGILNRYDEKGVLYTDIHSASKDFYWLAGRDVFLPINTSDGDWVGFLLVRHFGFDLDGVPDGSGERREALRSSLGNLKRNAERLFRKRPEKAVESNGPEWIKGVRVLGKR